MGIAASDMLGWPPPASYALLLIFLVSAVAVRDRHPGVADALWLIGLALAGMSWHALVVASASHDRIGPTDAAARVPFTARIVDPPVRHPRTWAFAAEVGLPPEAWPGRSQVRARVTLPIDGQAPEPRAGDLWLLQGSVEPFPQPRNPGEMDYGAMLSMAGIDAVIRARSGTKVHEPTSFDHRSMLGSVQSRLYTWIDHLHDGERSGFLKGVILGYRSELAEDLKSAFLATGTVHILAVSGGNVALIALVMVVVAGLARAGRRASSVVAIAGVLFYMWVTGSSPSVVRASVMAIVVLTAGVTGRRADVWQSLAVAALILLILDPRTLFDVGFQLSFISVIAIVAGTPMLETYLRRLPEEFRDHGAVRAVVQLLAVSAAAQIGTLPLTMTIFGQVSLVSVLANLVVVPLSGVALVLGVIELLVYPVSTWIASVYAGANDVVMDLLLGTVRRAATVPFAAVDAWQPDGWTMSAAYAFLAALAVGSLQGLRRALILAGCVLATAAVWRPIVMDDRHLAEVLSIDVGQGDAHLVRTFGGRTALIDAGPSEQAADRTILPLLRRLGVRTIDDLVITHGHRDHAGGLARLLDRLPVRTLTLSDSASVGEEVRRAASRNGVRIRVVRRGDLLSLDPSVRLYVLHPDGSPGTRSANDRSVVVRLLAGATSYLLTGDLEEPGEDELLGRYGDLLRSDVLKVAHHGSNTGTTKRWLDRVRPTHAVISVGRGNSFGHPDPERLSEFHQRRIVVNVTMEEGAVWYTTDGRHWSRKMWRRPQP